MFKRFFKKFAFLRIIIVNRREICSSSCTRKEFNVSECTANLDSTCIYDMCAIQPGTPQPCVVIIGGGMAGLSAASRLVQCGITNFKILEAMEQPGGRVRTCWLADTAIETGWPWIEGASIANPIFTLAATERLLPVPLPAPEGTDGEELILTAEGRAVDFRLAGRAKELFAEVRAAASEPGPVYPPVSSLGELISAALQEKLKELPKFEKWDVARAFHGYMGALKTKLGHSLNELCPDTLKELSPLPGGKVRLKGGMTSLLAPLVRGLPPGALVSCKPVNTVLWGTAGPGAPRALVRTCDGENFPADYVIVTVPLGVLKSSGDRMFCPQLPAFKMDAVKGLGFGSVSRIFLKFETPFWAESGRMMISWTPEEYDMEETWIRGVTTLESLPGSKKVLSVTVSGREAEEVEGLKDCRVVDDLGRLLSRFLGSPLLPRPSEIYRSTWHTSPYFAGYQTYFARKAGRGMVKSLETPLPSDCDEVPPIILFAGEHTHPDYFGTLHGSRLSGIREADRIVQLTKKFQGPPNKGPVCIPCH